MSAELTNRFAFHRRHPNVSIDAYARQCCIDLGVSLAGRKRIYLDKCFWVHLRDVRLARSQSQSAKDLLELLTHGVSSRALVCPISDTLFLELLKQTDVRSRRATAELIDELSQGVCLAPNQVRVATEVAHMLHAGAGLAVHPLEELVWTKVSNVLGMHHPVNGMFAPAEQLVIQKAFFDHRWTHSLAAIVDTIGESMPTKSSMVDLADRLNIENAEHSDEMRSFLHVYRSEIDGVLELAAPIGVDVLHQMAVDASVRTADATPDQLSALEKQVLGLLRAAVRKPAGRRALRTLHIGATLHAAIRWNKTQKLDANDLYDFHHAEAALGYCDVFLTDGPMCDLLSRKYLGLHEDFPCQVETSMAAAVKLLS